MKKNILIFSTFLLVIYLSCYHYADSYDCAITWNISSGEVKRDTQFGHRFSPPWVLVSKIDTRPRKVCIVSATRNINCRLVQFIPERFEELIHKEGFYYYWWYNRFSFNWGQETYRGFDNLFLGHAYGVNRCSCFVVTQEIGDE